MSENSLNHFGLSPKLSPLLKFFGKLDMLVKLDNEALIAAN